MKPRLKMNIGISNPEQTVREEAEKIELAIKEGVDLISQISIHKDKIDDMWNMISDYKNEIKFCSVPIYETIMKKKTLLETIEKHYEKGVRCFTLHTTPRFMFENVLKNFKNFCINSRGGMFLVDYFKDNPNKENPCISEWNDIQEFLKDKKDCEIFIGEALRPGHTKLSDDDVHYNEVKYFKENGFLDGKNVLECGGHMKYNHFKEYSNLIGEENPVCIMGPLITEATNGYDHITSIAGQLLFASIFKNINTLLILTPAEHLHLPNLQENEEGIRFAKLCQHYIGLLYNDEKTLELEKLFRTRPNSCNNKYNLFGPIENMETCNMCGDFCPLKKIDNDFVKGYEKNKKS